MVGWVQTCVYENPAAQRLNSESNKYNRVKLRAQLFVLKNSGA